jgi:regulator of protease activity HflC (stomatin/prohibitin superfamily)
MLKKLMLGVAGIAMAVSLSACGQTVQPGNEGIMIKQYGGNAGVQEQPLSTGWHATSPGEYIVEYPTITRNYSWTRPGDGDNKNANEEIVFADNTGLPMSADVQVTLAIDPSKVADIYKMYRLDFNDLLDGPVRSEVRTAIAAEASKFAAVDMFSSARATVMQKSLADVQQHFKDKGIIVSDLQWLGNIRAPDSVQNAIQQRTQVEQQTQIAIQQKAKAEAEAAAKIAEAQGDKQVRELNAEALNTTGGDKVLRQQWIQKWDGHLPSVVGVGQTSMLNIPSDK